VALPNLLLFRKFPSHTVCHSCNEKGLVLSNIELPMFALLSRTWTGPEAVAKIQNEHEFWNPQSPCFASTFSVIRGGS